MTDAIKAIQKAILGEKKICGEWFLLSYKAPARLSDLFNEGLVDRKLVKGKSGSNYYAYKLKERHESN